MPKNSLSRLSRFANADHYCSCFLRRFRLLRVFLCRHELHELLLLAFVVLTVEPFGVAIEALQEDIAFGDAGHQGAHKRPESTMKNRHVAMPPGKRRELDPSNPRYATVNEIERLKRAFARRSSIRFG